jgi:peroxiredoxin
MKHLHYYSLSIVGLVFFLFGNLSTESSAKEVQVSFSMTNCEKVDSLYVFEFNGVGFDKKGAAAVEGDKALFSFEKSDLKFLYFGIKEQDLKPVIIGKESEIALSGDCKTGFRSSNFTSEGLNQDYEAFKFKMTAFANETGALARQYQIAAKDEAAKKDLAKKFNNLDERKLEYHKQLKKDNPYLAKIFALNTYLSYQNNGSKYENEVEYYAKEYFSMVDWKDKDLNHLPWVYESIKSYTTTLSRINLPLELHQQYLNGLLAEIPDNSRTYQYALGGVISALEQAQHANFKMYGQQFVDKYGNEMPEAASAIKGKLVRMKSTVAGGEAPDFTMDQPDGTPLSLQDFRGKVTLIDFWASWCGPCRRENPNVVKMYEEYHDKGFEILGVSLDKSKDKWLAAIEKDGLTWKHVSDLKGWQNEVAKIYGVRSIPHTVLVDEEGKIIARGLRGARLEQELAKIFK